MNFSFVFQKYFVLLRLQIRAGCGAVGSALRSGRRGRRFESCHPDFVPCQIILYPSLFNLKMLK